MQRKEKIIRAALNAFHYTGAHHALSPFLKGMGVILTLHHVRPRRDTPFQPNHHLEITPEFLRETLSYLTRAGYDLVSMDEVHRRLSQKRSARPFACFTLDDGYLDNREHALPIMEEFGAPLTIYVTTDFPAGKGLIWWIALERIIAGSAALDVTMNGQEQHIPTGTTDEKYIAYMQLHDWLRALPDDSHIQTEVRRIASRHSIDISNIINELCLNWDDITALAAHPLVTFGAHTLSHAHLASLSPEAALHELAESKRVIGQHLMSDVTHLAYPYGDKNAASTREYALAVDAGFKTAVTTRPGVLHAGDIKNASRLLRISLNGNFQDRRYLPILLSGSATAAWAALTLLR